MRRPAVRDAVLPRVPGVTPVKVDPAIYPYCTTGQHMVAPRTMPEFLRFASVIRKMECVCGCEIDNWYRDIEQTRDELFVRGAAWHLAWWEQEMRLAPRPTDTIYERQDRIISRMRAWRLPTPAVITRVSNAYHLGLVVPVMDYEQHYIIYYFVEGKPSNVEDAQGELLRITPARLGIGFIFRKLTWGELFGWSLRGGGAGGTHTWQRLFEDPSIEHWEDLMYTVPPYLPQ